MAKPRKRGAKAYGWDRFIGILGMIVDVLAIGLGGFAAGIGLTDSKLMKLDQPKVVGGIGLFIVLVGVIRLILDIGIFNSRRWAFIVAALLSGWGIYSGSVVPSSLMLLYAVLRLGQVFGPNLR